MHQGAEEQLSKKPKVNSDKTAVALLKDTRQSECVFSGRRAAKVFIDLTEEHKSLETNLASKIDNGEVTQTFAKKKVHRW